jgi:hypothetical protein
VCLTGAELVESRIVPALFLVELRVRTGNGPIDPARIRDDLHNLSVSFWTGLVNWLAQMVNIHGLTSYYRGTGKYVVANVQQGMDEGGREFERSVRSGIEQWGR